MKQKVFLIEKRIQKVELNFGELYKELVEKLADYLSSEVEGLILFGKKDLLLEYEKIHTKYGEIIERIKKIVDSLNIISIEYQKIKEQIIKENPSALESAYGRIDKISVIQFKRIGDLNIFLSVLDEKFIRGLHDVLELMEILIKDFETEDLLNELEKHINNYIENLQSNQGIKKIIFLKFQTLKDYLELKPIIIEMLIQMLKFFMNFDIKIIELEINDCDGIYLIDFETIKKNHKIFINKFKIIFQKYWNEEQIFLLKGNLDDTKKICLKANLNYLENILNFMEKKSKKFISENDKRESILGENFHENIDKLKSSPEFYYLGQNVDEKEKTINRDSLISDNSKILQPKILVSEGDKKFIENPKEEIQNLKNELIKRLNFLSEKDFYFLFTDRRIVKDIENIKDLLKKN